MENNNNNLIESKNNYLIEKNNNYSIDEELINDIECKHNNKKNHILNFVYHVKRIFVIGVKDMKIIKLLILIQLNLIKKNLRNMKKIY